MSGQMGVESPGRGPLSARLAVLEQLTRRPLSLLGILLLAAWIILMVAPQLVTPIDPLASNMGMRLKPPSLEHPFGTDHLGRDLLSRVVYGTRDSLVSACIVVLIATVIGSVLGATAGYVGRLPDTVIMRMVDLLLSFPLFILAMAIVTALGRGMSNAIIAGAIVWWAQYARLMRGAVLATRDLPYVEAARASGCGDLRLLFRHIVPNCLTPIIVKASSDVGYVLLVLTGLSFLGLGTQPPDPEWGQMITESRNFMFSSWWYPAFPGLAIFTAGISFNLIGDGLAEAMNPQLRVGQRSRAGLFGLTGGWTLPRLRGRARMVKS